jgi:glycosyltransferase involved in cell wall biosynthesis
MSKAISPLHQLVHTLSYGDAISTEVLALQRALRERGVPSEIFSINCHPKLKGQARHFSEIEGCEAADLILHYSLGSPLNDVYRGWTKGRRVLVYHNITPSLWYRSINSRVADDIEVGISELPHLCSVSDTIWADSDFNAQEIQVLGYEARVLDLLVDPGRWQASRNEPLYQSVVNTPGTQVLHVGRIAPNKRLEDVIKSFYFLRKYRDPEARLRLVGIDTDTELYSFSLRELAAYLGIAESVEFVGGLADDEVRAMYEASDVYLCMSEHEGFCLPLIEAMHFRLPIVAFAAGAVPATLGGAGILVSEKRHAEVGELLWRMTTDASLRDSVIARGIERVEAFTYERFSNRMATLVRDLHQAESTTRRSEACAI